MTFRTMIATLICLTSFAFTQNPAQKTLSQAPLSEDTSSKTSISQDAASEDTASKASISQDAPSEDTASKTFISQDAASEDTASKASISQDALSEDTNSKTSISKDVISKKENCTNGKKTNRVRAKHIEGGGIGYNQGYTTLEGFFSWNHSQALPFLDARAHVFNDGKFALNAGIGVRSLLTKVVLGGNIYYDYRQTHHFHYNQVGIGFEVLGAMWEGRLNGYLPVGRKQSHPYDKSSTSVFSSPTPFAFDTFSNNSMILSSQSATTTTNKNKVEFAMKGMDAEVGAHFFTRDEIDLYAGIGPYYFQGYHNKKAIGGKARITANLTPYVSLSGIYSNDSLFHSRIQGELALNFSFGPQRRIQKDGISCANAIALQDRFVQPVWRQEIIVKSRKKQTLVSEGVSTQTAIAINPATGSPWNFLFVNNTSSSNGTFESPFNNLVAAQNASNPNDVIYVYPGDGTSTGLSSPFLMKTGQKLLGTSLPYSFNTQYGSMIVPAMSLEMPHLSVTDAIGVTMVNECTVSGLFITSTIATAKGSAIGNTTSTVLASVPPISNPVITNNRIEQTVSFNGTADGIVLVNSTGVATISNNQITSSASALASLFFTGITLANGTFNGSHVITKNTISLTNTTGIRAIGIAAFTQANANATSQIEENQISLVSSSALNGISINALTGGQHTTLIQNNFITGSQNSTLNTASINCGSSGSGSVISGQVLSNTSTLAMPGPSALQTGIMLDLSGASSNFLIQNNTASNSTTGVYARSNLQDGSTIRILNNACNGNTNAAVMTTNSGTLCARYQNNSALSPSSVIECTQSSMGIFNLEPLVGNTGTLSTSGTITDVAQDFCGN